MEYHEMLNKTMAGVFGLALMCMICINASTATAVLTVVVESQGVARTNSPTNAGMTVKPGDVKLLETLAAKGIVLQPGNVPAQLVLTKVGDAVQTANVYWIEPSLKAGAKKTYTIEAAAAKASASFSHKDVEGGLHRDFYFGGKPVVRHAFLKYDKADHFTTYKHFHHLFSRDGKSLITNGPGSIPDYKKARYPHHRGLYIGWSKTSQDGKSYDFWHCTKDVSVRHKRFNESKNFEGPIVARSESHAEWTGAQGNVVVKEKRRLTMWQVKPGVMVLDFSFALDVPFGGKDVNLNGDPQHAGFQFRPHNDVTKSHAKYIKPATASGGKGDVWKTTPWVANQFEVKGEKYVVVHMDHKGNPGTVDGRTVYSTRNYGRFGAYAPHKLASGKSSAFAYRVMLIDPNEQKDLSVATIGSWYKDFVTSPRAIVHAK
jgi:hypothetical protein